jgi:microsomal dipeptidase-like Zn-dependent dipeptidase
MLNNMLQRADKRYRVHHREAVGDLAGEKRVYVLTEALIRRKYTDDHIRLVLGGNWRRVLDSIWSSRQG